MYLSISCEYASTSPSIPLACVNKLLDCASSSTEHELDAQSGAMEKDSTECVRRVCISGKAIVVASESFQRSCYLPGVFLEFVTGCQSFDTGSKDWMFGHGCEGVLETVLRFDRHRTRSCYNVASLVVVRAKQWIFPGLNCLLRQCQSHK
jgi:hypothetical protein